MPLDSTAASSAMASNGATTSMRHSVVILSLMFISLALVIIIMAAGLYNRRQALAVLTEHAETAIEIVKPPLSEAIAHTLPDASTTAPARTILNSLMNAIVG